MGKEVTQLRQIDVQSDTKLEQDSGSGKKVIVRCYEFASNPEAFKQHKPSKQQLFDYHKKGIEIQLWSDGLKQIPEVEPKIIISKNKKNYRIYVGAEPQHGQVILEQPKTLSQIAHNT